MKLAFSNQGGFPGQGDPMMALMTVNPEADGAMCAAGVTRVFWSGGDVAREAAETWAKANGGITLEMTAMGKQLTELTKNMAWEDAEPLWKEASAGFANSASGDAHVFQRASGVSTNSIWGNVEYQILKEKGIDVVYHVIE